VDPSGAGGGTGWIIGPEGELLAGTSAEAPWVTVDIDLASQAAARYPQRRSSDPDRHYFGE
jgi:hypothetical protein